MPHERSPLLELLTIAAPTAAAMMSFTIMQFVDAAVISRMAPDPVNIAAQGNGGIAAWVPISTMTALLGVINTYVSQNIGAGRPERTSAYIWNALWMAVGAWVLLVPFGLLLPTIFESMGHDERRVALASAYGRVLVFGSILPLAARAFNQFFYGLHRPAVVLVSTILGNITNLFANLVLVFGKDGTGHAVHDIFGQWAAPAVARIAGASHWIDDLAGVPGMGVPGSAVGTLFGLVVELAIPVVVFLSPGYNRKYGTRSAWRLSWPHVRDIARLGWPAALMVGNEMICWAIFMAAFVGHFGKEHNAAGWIALRYMQVSFLPALGISFAVQAMVGKCMGMKRPDLASARARLGLTVTMIYMGVCAIGMILFAGPMVEYFVPDYPPDMADQIRRIGVQVMIVAAIFQLFDAMGITMISALRGAGDTIWPGMAVLVLSWTCLIGVGGLLVVFAPGLKSVGPWIGAAVYIILLGITLGIRYRQGKWRSMDLLRSSAGNAQSPTSANTAPPESQTTAPTAPASGIDHA